MPGEITKLLAEVQSGDRRAESQLAVLVYGELHRMAARYMRREQADNSLQATILVHEAYLRLVNQEDQTWQNRAHFFATAARLMRQILIDHARNRNAAKRGGPHVDLRLDDLIVVSDDRLEQVIAIDEALTRLAERDARLARIVEMRFFAGLTEEEIAEVLGVSPRTVKRDWRVAKAWLHGELSGSTDDDGAAVGAG
ncbi:MAG TPA: sigma-70 family RNA polymerase sigma factor [Bryobacteraceae bacterium]|jgi:RNA polymerase sigma factor (TIGR02999 family)|nr:sigma-70 family RNA polymerase sigma factor [Bryobacteraceae bacterium]